MTSSVLNATSSVVTSLVGQIRHLNDAHFKRCVLKTAGTGVGAFGAVTLMGAPFAKGGLETLSAVAVGSFATLAGVGINLATDFVVSRQSSSFIAQLTGLSSDGRGRDKKELKRIEALSFADPSALLQMVGIGGQLHELRLLSAAAKLFQVHALLVRMFLINAKLLVKYAVYKNEGSLYTVLSYATSKRVNDGLKWAAVVATGLVVLIDVALVINEWQSGGAAVAAGERVVEEIQKTAEELQVEQVSASASRTTKI